MRRGSVRHRLLAAIEAMSRRRADAIVVLTERLRADFVDRGARAPVTVIPCCVDAGRFRFDAGSRAARRRELNVGADRVLVYVGKTGPRYLVDETMLFAKAIAREVGAVRLLVLTNEAPDGFEALARRIAFDPSLLSVRRVAPADVPGWLCAADAGMALIRQAFSEQGSSPIKISEYLAAGLPVITTASIGDVSAAIDRASLGVVVADRSERARAAAVSRLRMLWSAADDTRRRCAEWAQSSLDLHAVAVPRYRQVYDGLLSSRSDRTTIPTMRGSEGV